MRWFIALALFAGSIARAEIVTTPPQATASGAGLTLSVVPVLASTRHLMDVDGNMQPACDEEVGCPPVLPFGSIWIELRNDTDEPVTVRPDELGLRARGKTHRALETKADIDKRWHEVLWRTEYIRTLASDSLEQILHDRVPVLAAPTTIGPHDALRTYVAFDVDARRRYEYDDFLRDAEQLFVVLQTGHARITATFIATDR